jgi:positive phototaxis protein PixI
MTANTTLARLQQLLPQLFNPVAVSGDLYLRFQLTPELPALLTMNRVQEALLIPASQISPLPNMPEFTIGMTSFRDRVLCVVDLAQLLGLPPLPPNLQDYQVVIINLLAIGAGVHESSESSTGKYLGLAVQRVRGVTRFRTETIKAEGVEVAECLRPYLSGYFLEESEQVLLLNTTAIATSPNLFQNPFG